MSFKTAKGRVIGLGSAKEGAHHWFGERLKAVALIPLTIAFIAINWRRSHHRHHRIAKPIKSDCIDLVLRRYV